MDKSLKIAVILSAVDNMTRVVTDAVNHSVHKLHEFAEHTDRMAKKAFEIGRTSAEIGLAIAEPLHLAIEAAEEGEVANRRLENVFKQMGDRHGEAAEQAINYSKALERAIGVNHAEIEGVQAKIATFGRVSDESARMAGIFDRATAAAYDLAETGFGDATTNATQLGKALQDPIKGITALARSGVTFTAQEKAKIKTLVESGKLLEAQKVVLKAIEKQVGGTAKATVTEGKRTKVMFHEMAETIGKVLVPEFNRMLGAVMKQIEKVIEWVHKNPELTHTILMVASAVAAVSFAVSALSFIFGGILKVISIGTTIIEVLTTVFGYLSTALSFLTSVVRVLTAVMMANPIFLIITLIATAALLIYKYWEPIKKFFIDLWEGIKSAFHKFWEWVINLPFMKPIKLIIDNWDKIKLFFTTLWDYVKGKFTGFMDWLTGLPGRMYTAGVNIVKSIWEGIKSMVNKPIDAIKNMVQKIRDHLPFSPAKIGPLRDIHRIKLIETIADNMKPGPMVKAMRNATAAVMISAAPVGISAQKASSASPGRGGGGGMVVHYNPQITITGGDSNTIQKMFKEHEAKIVKVIQEAQRKADRSKF